MKEPKVEIEIESGEDEGGEASAESVMDTEREIADQQMAGVAGSAPTPTAPIQANVVMDLAAAVTSVMIAVGGPDAGSIEVDLPMTKSVKTPIPDNLWVPLSGLSMALTGLASTPGGEVLAPYTFDAAAAASNPTEMAATVTKLSAMSQDKAAVDFLTQQVVAAAEMQTEMAGPPAAEPPAPAMA